MNYEDVMKEMTLYIHTMKSISRDWKIMLWKIINSYLRKCLPPWSQELKIY